MARPGTPRGTSQDRSRRRMAMVLVVVGVVVLVGWIAAVAALAGGSGGSTQGGAEGAASDSPEQDQGALSETTAEDSVQGGQGKPSGGDQGDGSQPDQGVSSGEAETRDVFGSLEEQGQPQGDHNASDTAETAASGITRARAASEDFITAAYGYSGESSNDYMEGIEQAASEEIYDSPGGSMLKGYSQAAPECGMRSTAVLEEFEVIGRSPEGLDATVTFSVEDADGQTHTFSQDQRLISSDGAYEVSGVSMEELISDTTPQESCPGANSENELSEDDSSGGEKQDEIKPSGTSVADEDRAKAAAGRYISSAYGYTGDSGKDYRDGINRTADTKALYSSPGGERIREYAKAAEEDGITAAAVMESFEITSVTGEATDEGIVKGTAYFKVGREYGRYGEITGETTPFEVDLTLSPVRSTYEVSASSLEREVSGESGAGPAKKTK